MQQNAIVSESLCGQRGYVKWSIQMKTYLLGQDLWDIVEADEPTAAAGAREVEIKAWKKKNAVALHAIQISCSKPAFDLIQDKSSANIAWDTLAENYKQQAVEVCEKSKNFKPAFKLAKDCKQSKNFKQAFELANVSKQAKNFKPAFEFDDDEFDDEFDSDESESNCPTENEGDLRQYEPLLKALKSGDWKAANSFLAKDPEAVRARITSSDKNALHVAVAAGHTHIVEKLVQLMTEEDLLMKGKDRLTVLAVAIEIGNISIAECLIRKNKKLVRVPVKGSLPVLYAFLFGQIHMVRFLYSLTPLEDLISVGDGKQGSELVYVCVKWKQFDIALHLVERHPRLAITTHAHRKSPVVALANSKVFASVGQLKFWQRWIYDRIPEPDCAKNHISLDVQNLNDSLSHKDITVVSSGVFRRFVGDVKDIYEMKLVHAQALELLNRMCKVIETTSDPKLITDAGVAEAMIQAVHNGNVEFIKSIAKANPELVWTPSTARNIFSRAIQLQKAEVFSLIYGFHNKQAVIQSYADPYTMPPPMYNGLPTMPPPRYNGLPTMPPPMYNACPTPPSIRQQDLISGPALQLQRNLQWDEEIETIFPLEVRECWNKTYLQPFAFSRRPYMDLVKSGESWMKDISRSCIVVGSLVIAIMFAAALLVPGGNIDQDTGIPLFMKRKFFKAFAISDALSLFSSTISVLMFLRILTSRYAEEDFLKSLPTKMIIGLSTLLFSIATMVIAFSVAFSTMLREDSWIGSTPVILLAGIPVTFSFMLMHFPLLVDITMSTYGPSIFNRKVKPWL